MAAKAEWFTGNKSGLERIAKRRGHAYVLFELLQNAWDTGAQRVTVTLDPIDGRPRVRVRVEDDDPDGFRDLTHAYTLFAESEKKSHPTQRGRFNLGEKLVLAICESAEVLSTKGAMVFDDAGRHTSRKRRERGTAFELGIPVHETGDPWDVDVGQKVPVNMERNSIPSAYLKTLRVHVLNAVAERLAPEQATTTAVEEAISDPRISAQALDVVLTHRFGEKRAITDPSDREAENRLKAQGYTIIPGRSLPPGTFHNIRTHGVAMPSGQVSPSYKPYSDDPSAPPAELIPEADRGEFIDRLVRAAVNLIQE